MKYLFAPTTMIDQASVDTLKALLEKENIPCLVRNEHLSIATGEIPFQESLPQLWVLNDADYPKAYELVETWRSSPVEIHGQWLCTDCEETIEGQFTSCWKCGKQHEKA
ncbi:MAG: DUF2007 domain-containing protein [Pyrinomonadaceae bacterium]